MNRNDLYFYYTLLTVFEKTPEEKLIVTEYDKIFLRSFEI